MIKSRISHFIEKQKLITGNDKILVALSGGADSVALLHVLISLKYNCVAAHCNFRLRDSESDRDELFVRRLCNSLQVPLHVVHFDTRQYAAQNKISIEMAARELRYNWFAQVKEATNASVIAIAHHQNDSTETMLLNLIRGTGINGLLGIRPKNGDIVRPLLCVTRNEIIEYLQQLNQDYVTDSTNLSDEFTRNKIRLKLIPLMQEINPSVNQSLVETGDYLQEVANIYHIYIEEARKRVGNKDGIVISRLLEEISPRALLFEILHPLGFNSTQIENVFLALQSTPGKQFFSNSGYRLVRDREILFIIPPRDDNDICPFELVTEENIYTPDFAIPREKDIACLDADKITQPLTARKWQHGDAFIPFGMKGRKLVSDYMTDRKYSILQKENQWVLCSDDAIVWLIGERMDNRFRIDEHTKRVLVVRMKKKEITRI
ncbi:tRNA lysidine(34) synthetase TilS [Bacteroides sp. OttesenSCG-928-D19]|nr:tRNA lysidine(34) synthetase TilS [Bacteroides sp. OttesenSCG-928-D19]